MTNVCEHQPHALGAPVRCANVERDAMPGARDGERAMPDAQWIVAGCAARQPPCVEAWPLQRRGEGGGASGIRARIMETCYT